MGTLAFAAWWMALADGAGVPIDGYPSAAERLQLVAINRARADPNNVEKGTSHECSELKDARPPVVLNHDLCQSSRFHCTHLALNGGGLSHQTFCTLRDDLEAAGCDGTAACSCVEGTECWNCDTLGGCGSGPDERAAIFGFAGGVAEVGAAGYPSGWDAVTGWMTENPCESATLAHRDTVTGDLGVVGVGEAQGGTCWGTYHFADFANVEGTVIPAIPSGAVRNGTEAYANWFHASGDPMMIEAVVDGVCTSMSVDLGEAGNATFVATLPSVDAACHNLYFLAYDADGNRVTYPEIGSLTFGTGCAEEYVVEQAPADCDAFESCGDDTCDANAGENCSSCPDDCDPCPSDDSGSAEGSSADGSSADGSSAEGGSVSSASADGGSDGTDGSSGADGGANDDDSGCACRSSPRTDGEGWLALLGLVLATTIRSRRR
jgi:MYXO-CTERM domain-containing protein